VNLAGWRFLVFAMAGAAGIIVLASIGMPGRKRSEELDRYTGKQVLIVRTIADAYHEARFTGNARLALAKVSHRVRQFPGNAVLIELKAVLEGELASVTDPPPPDHPDLAAVEAERERASKAREELRRRVGERVTKEALFALLSDLEADEACAASVETYFQPLVRLRAGQEVAPDRPDEIAARTLAALESTESAPGPELFLEVASSFRAHTRTRARARWLLRAYGALPDIAAVRDPLVQYYLEQGRLMEAFLVIGVALQGTPDDVELWQLRARLAGWLSLPHQEAEAQRALLAAGESEEIHRRLITLYDYIGRPQDAIPHARAVTRNSNDPKQLEWPVRLALDGGQVGRALGLYEELARESDDPAYWREKIVEVAWADMRVELVLEQLELLRRLHPDRDYEQRLEGVLRRRNMRARLVKLLEERLLRTPDDERLESELLSLHSGLGNHDAVRAILRRRLDRVTDPLAFFSQLSLYRAMKLQGLPARARAMIAAPELTEQDVPAVLYHLTPLDKDPKWRGVLVAFALRFARHPQARHYLLTVVDAGATGKDRSSAAEKLALDHLDDRELHTAWIQRASWAGEIESEIRAREAWVERDPQDDANREALADLYAAVNRPADAVVQWRFLTRKQGVESKAVLRLIDVLFATGEIDEAIGWLEQRATLPNTSIEDRLFVAEQLFSSALFDRALRFYMAVLDHDPDHALSLLRAGQVRSWTNDPRGAIPFFEKRLDVSDEEVAEVRFYLGESHWAVREDEAGKRYHEAALEELEAKEERTITQNVMVAKILTRFGRVEEARPIFERVLKAAPKNVDLVLDYADAMIAIRNTSKARELVLRAQELAPQASRTMRTDGKVAVLERRYADGARILAESIELYGPEAGVESELGQAHELAGDWTRARGAYERSLALQPDNRDVEEAFGRMADSLARILHAGFDVRRAGDDKVFGAWAAASTIWKNERTRLAAGFGITSYTGRAQAVDAGLTDLSEMVATVRVTAFRRIATEGTAALGVEVFPGAPGDAPVGVWAGAALRSNDPFRMLAARVHYHTLLDDPAAAVALGGRSTGIQVRAEGDIGRNLWAAVDAEYRLLSLDSPSAEDAHFRGSASLGWRIIKGDLRVGERFGIDRSTLPGLLGPDIFGDPSETRGPLVSVWATYQAFRLLGDQELASLLPIGTSFDYLTVAARADFHVSDGVGAKIEGYFGEELQSGEFIAGLGGGVSWRPTREMEVTAIAGLGQAFGRSESELSFHLRIGFSYRW